MNEMPKCNQEGCDAPPAFRFTWPGRNEAFICSIHALKAKQIAEAMGLHLQMIQLEVSDYLRSAPPPAASEGE